jgi:glycosyltransferase involved in cell wall biosynthesis
MQTISVITCTYNPNPKIFERVLRSIECQSIENFDIEYVIVDNNSNPPVSEMPCVQAFLARNAWAKVITERRQGLSYARIAGVKEASSDIIIFVDDDNELDKEYIKNAVQIIHERDYVGIWGPGKISVEFVDGAPALVDKKMRMFFLEKDIPYEEFGLTHSMWERFYPSGAGQVIRRDILMDYIDFVERGVLTATDRTGASLASAGDAQIIWTAVKKNKAVGISPRLKLNHLIPKKRANMKYIRRLAFWLHRSQLPAFIEAFPHEKQNVKMPSLLIILVSTLKMLLKACYDRGNTVSISSFLGDIAARQAVLNSSKYNWLIKIAACLGWF